MYGHIWILIATGVGAADEPAKDNAPAAEPTVVAEAPASEPAPTPRLESATGGSVFALPLPAVASREADAGKVVDRVQKFYKKTDRMTANFRQTYTNQTFGEPTHSDGLVYIKKPGKMRWDYYKGKRIEKSFISDGSTLWAVDNDNKQVFKRDLEKNLLPVAISFLYGKGDLRRDFEPDLDTSNKYGSKNDHVLRLVPRKPSAQYKTLYLVVDPKTYEVKQSIVIESSGNTNHFRFVGADLKRDVKDTWFYFNEKSKAVKDYRIIDADEEQKKSQK